MYNRYLDQQPEQSRPALPPEAQRPGPAPAPPPRKSCAPSAPLGDVTAGLSQLLRGVLDNFHLGDLDTGDILLVLIILFLFLEGDNLELVITLGLMLLLGLGDDDQPCGV